MGLFDTLHCEFPLPARIEAALARLPGQAGEDVEARIHNALYTFFARYYDSGDFLPRQRRVALGGSHPAAVRRLAHRPTDEPLACRAAGASHT